MKGILLISFAISILSQCYLFRDSWIFVTNGSILISTRSNILWVGFRINDTMIRGNLDTFYLSPYHDYSNIKSIPFKYTSSYFINTYTIPYINPNTSAVAIAENTETSNLNITHTDKSGILTSSSFCMSSMGLPGKISSVNPWSFLLVIIFYICLFFVALKMWDKEPFKHKNLCFLICIFGETVYSLGDRIENQYTFEWYTVNGCYIDAFVIYPSQQLTFILPLILYFRYLVLLRINLNKMEISEEENIIDSLRWDHKFFHKLTSKYITIFVPIIYVGIFMDVMFIILAVNKFQCTPYTFAFNTYNHLIFSTICAAGFIFLLLIDMVRVFPLIFKGKWRQYLNNDPHYFRLEHLSIALLVICFILWATGILGKTGNMIIIEIAFLLTIAINGGISLLLTIFFELYKYLKPISTDTDSKMKTILSGEDKELKKMFKDFCQKEWSVENYLCMDYILKYRNVNTQEERKKIAEIIEVLHLNESCQYEVNIKDVVKKKTILRIKEEKYNISMLDDLALEINRNLLDTYSRFIVSSSYLEREKKNLVLKNMKDVLKN